VHFSGTYAHSLAPGQRVSSLPPGDVVPLRARGAATQRSRETDRKAGNKMPLNDSPPLTFRRSQLPYRNMDSGARHWPER
jgi:hypothetical protein